jgi:hypothetical protein
MDSLFLRSGSTGLHGFRVTRKQYESQVWRTHSLRAVCALLRTLDKNTFTKCKPGTRGRVRRESDAQRFLSQDLAGFGLSYQTVGIVGKKVPSAHHSLGGGAHLRDIFFVGPIALFE